MHAALAVTLCALIASPALAGAASDPLSAAIPSGEVRALLDSFAPAIGSRRPMPGIDFPDRRQAEPASLACGVYGLACARAPLRDSRPSFQQAQVTPLNTGFKALGPAGKGGKIDGPGKKGNGTYRVLKNDPYELSFEVHTGYIDGVTTFKRDPSTGRDTASFVGKLWDGEHDAWGPPLDKTGPVEFSYDPAADEGRVRWNEDGTQKSEGYWGGGRDGKRSMTIEFGGGWDHDFLQD